MCAYFSIGRRRRRVVEIICTAVLKIIYIMHVITHN